ncbi:MAG: hypothetical protein HC915_10490 [Anaerolineae bacterium]|nr:hypothetical protein [Anaerolineae bacterium]
MLRYLILSGLLVLSSLAGHAAAQSPTPAPETAYGLRLVVAPLPPEAAPEPSATQEPPPPPDLEAIAEVLRARLEAATLLNYRVTVGEDENTLVIEAFLGQGDDRSADAFQASVLESVARLGSLEFVDFSALDPADVPSEGDCILTTELLRVAGADFTCAGAPGVAPMPAALDAASKPFPTLLTSAALANAQAIPNSFQNESWGLSLEFTDEAAAILADFTAAHIGEPLGIVLDGVVLLVPIIQAPIFQYAWITSDFDRASAEKIATLLQGGALPVRLEVLEVTLLTFDTP